MDFNNKCYYTTQGNIKCNNDMIENFGYEPCGPYGNNAICSGNKCCGKNSTCGGDHNKKDFNFCINSKKENITNKTLYYYGKWLDGNYDGWSETKKVKS